MIDFNNAAEVVGAFLLQILSDIVTAAFALCLAATIAAYLIVARPT